MFRVFFRAIWALGLLKERSIKGRESAVDNRSLVIGRAANRRGLQFRQFYCLGQPTHFFSLTFPGRRLIFEHLPHLELGQSVGPVDVDDKAVFKSFASRLGIPVPAGRAFRYLRAGLAYGRALGPPLVVKPVSSSLSLHTTVNILTIEELARAIKRVQYLSRIFLVERFISGREYRATLVGGRLIACCEREPAHIVGDGERTIEELITLKNRERLRRGQGRNVTLRPIPFNHTTEMMLQQAGLGYRSKLPAGRKCYLQWKVSLRAGGDLHDVTDRVDRTTRTLFERLAAQSGCLLIGLDVIAQDISLPWSRQSFALLEANSAPRIDMHHHPMTGRARDVAGPLLDCLLG